MARYEILCVDHDAPLRNIIAHEIEEAGHFVISTGSGAAALAILAKNPAIDLVLVDLCMTDMPSGEFIQRIKSNWPKVKLALLTGYAEDFALSPYHGSQPFEGCPVIAKNARMEEILTGIESAARGEPPRQGRDSRLTRVEQLASERRAKPALEGIQRHLKTIYGKTIPDTLVKPLSKYLGRSSSPVFSETRR